MRSMSKGEINDAIGIQDLKIELDLQNTIYEIEKLTKSNTGVLYDQDKKNANTLAVKNKSAKND